MGSILWYVPQYDFCVLIYFEIRFQGQYPPPFNTDNGPIVDCPLKISQRLTFRNLPLCEFAKFSYNTALVDSINTSGADRQPNSPHLCDRRYIMPFLRVHAFASHICAEYIAETEQYCRTGVIYHKRLFTSYISHNEAMMGVAVV